MTLAQRVKALRSKAGLSQTELADKLVAAREDVQDWETGRVVSARLLRPRLLH